MRSSRDKGQGAVAVTLAVSVAGTVYARCRSAADGTTIVQAPWLAIGTAATGSAARSIAGVDARLGWFFLDLSGDGVTWQNGTVPIGMGALMMMAGQSLAVRIFRMYDEQDTTTIAAAGETIPANGRLFLAADDFPPTQWLQPATGTTLNGAGGCRLLNKLITVAGCNVGIVGRTTGQTAIAEWQIGQGNGDALLQTLDAAGGKFEIESWFQGHSDAANQATAAYYRGKLTSLFAGISAHNAFAAPLRLVASMPNVASDGWGSPEAIEVMRRASASWAAANNGVAVLMNDLQLSGGAGPGVHQTQAGAITTADHFYRACRPHFGAAGDDQGATLGQPTHAVSSANIVIPFTLPAGASQLLSSGSPATRFKVYKSGTRSNPLAFDATRPFAIDNAAKTITLTLAADPGQIGLDILPFGAIDAANDGGASLIYDDLTYGDGLTRGRQLWPGVEPLRITTVKTLAVTSGVYGAGRFGQTLLGGKAGTSGPILPSVADDWRIEARMRQRANQGVRVLLGAAGAFWIATNGADLIGKIGDSDLSWPNLFADTNWHDVALVFEGPQFAHLEVDGVAGATFGVSGYNGSLNVLGVRYFGGNGYDCDQQDVDEVALWRNGGPVGGMPASAYSGTEAGLIGLWHLDGDGANSAASS